MRRRILLALAIALGGAASAATAGGWEVRPPEGGEFAYSVPEAPPYGPGDVVVHYVASGADAPEAPDANGDGIPDPVAELADAAQQSLDAFAAAGFRAPPADSGEPDRRPDLYLKRLHEGVYGVAVSPAASSSGAFVVIATALSGEATTNEASLEGAVAHELFHLVQYAYVPNDSLPGWLAEATAAAAQQHAFPELRDQVLVQATRDWLRHPWRSLADEGDGCARCYGAALWWSYLARTDRSLLPAYLERVAAMRRRDSAALLNALDLELRAQGHSSLARVLAAFALDAYTRGPRPRSRLTLVTPRLGSRRLAGRLAPMAAEYIRLAPAPGARSVVVELSTRRPNSAALLLAGNRIVPLTGRRPRARLRLRHAGDRRILLILSNATSRRTEYALSATGE